MSKEAMKLALEALDEFCELGAIIRPLEVRDALREALAEQKSGIKQVIELYDSPDQPSQQEPVVWMYVNKSTHETKFQKHMRDFVDHGLWAEVPLYGEPLANQELNCVCGAVWQGDELVHLPRKPASKPWAGLTDEEIEKGRDQTFSINNPYCPCDSKTMRKAVRWAEAKLREKNNG